MTMEHHILMMTINNQIYPIVFTDKEHLVEVTVYKPSVSGTGEPPRYQVQGKEIYEGTTTTLNEAVRMIDGSIKWDGCSDLTFFPDDEGYVHFCGAKSACALGELIKIIHDTSKAILKKHNPNFDEELFG